jgi:hypothetical protein
VTETDPGGLGAKAGLFEKPRLHGRRTYADLEAVSPARAEVIAV